MTKLYTDNISGASVSSTPLVDAILKKSMTDVSQSYIDTFAKDAEAYKTQAKKDFSALDWNAATSEETSASATEVNATIQEMAENAAYLRSIAEELERSINVFKIR